jgi:hypothetical protein
MHLLGEVVGGPRRVEHDEPLGKSLRELTVALGDPTEEHLGLPLEPVVLASQPGADVARVERKQERTVGQEASDSRNIQLEHTVEAKPTPDALVGDGRVHVAVTDDQRTARQSWPDDLVHVLRTASGVEEGFRPRAHVPSVQDEVSKLLAELGAAGLARGEDVEAIGPEPGAQTLRLCRFPGSVEALERDEHRLPSYGRP